MLVLLQLNYLHPRLHAKPELMFVQDQLLIFKILDYSLEYLRAVRNLGYRP